MDGFIDYVAIRNLKKLAHKIPNEYKDEIYKTALRFLIRGAEQQLSEIRGIKTNHEKMKDYLKRKCNFS